MLKFLCRVADVLADYLGGLNEDLIKDNFVLVYQVLSRLFRSFWVYFLFLKYRAVLRYLRGVTRHNNLPCGITSLLKARR